ncbi:MAG: phosphoglycerate dehydrogenase [Pseudomonadota bacterium]|nr:phosphoglycerate dehydrogenase [Pseudomonadota bacterium]
MLPPKSHKILVTGKLHEVAIKALQALPNCTLTYRPDCKYDELLTIVHDYRVLVTRSETRIDRELIDRAAKLKIIGRAAVGVANIDLDYATERGILVINCPAKNTNSAAELAFALLLGVARNVTAAALNVQAGKWERHKFKGWELRGKSIGLVGIGNVGSRVCKFAHGFDMKVLGYDPYLSEDSFTKYEINKYDDLLALAADSDIMSLHVPLNKETTGMINLPVLKALGNSGILLNTARGDVVNYADLLQVLEGGMLAGVVLDTWHNEPQPDPVIYQHRLVFGTPHIGASTEEAQVAIGITIAEQVEKALAGDIVDYPVNVPHRIVITSERHRAQVVLAEKLGSLAGQLVSFHPNHIKFRHNSRVEEELNLLKVSWLKGFLQHIVDAYVSIVNCQQQLEKLGINISDEQALMDKSTFEVVLADHSNNQLCVGGVAFDAKTTRIVRIDEFDFEIKPHGCYLIIKNKDVPGVLGKLGTSLAQANINIGSVYMSRIGGIAMAAIEVDEAISNTEKEKLLVTENLLSLHQIEL